MSEDQAFYFLKPPRKQRQHCWRTTLNNVGLDVTLLHVVAQSLKPVKLLAPCKRTQH